jgi:hypothetical protein
MTHGTLTMDDFIPIHINAGTGSYHANRFRICFRAKRAQDAQNPSALVSDFIENFPHYFNPDNAAHVIRVASRAYNGSPAMRFRLDMRTLFSSINIPDWHSDWVGTIWMDPMRGFAVQTLMRTFLDPLEDMAAAGLSPFFWWAEGNENLLAYNRMHFLAGRRSWIIQPINLETSGKELSKKDSTAHEFIYSPVMMLETAALERYSASLYKLASADEIGVIIPSMKLSILQIWARLLENYCELNSFEIVSPVRIDSRDNLEFGDYGTIPWITEMTSMHPGLSTCIPT